jgi:hypothetical protein
VDQVFDILLWGWFEHRFFFLYWRWNEFKLKFSLLDMVWVLVWVFCDGDGISLDLTVLWSWLSDYTISITECNLMLHNFQQRTVKSRNPSHLHHRTIVPYFTLSPPQNSQKYNHSINFTEQSNLNLYHLHHRILIPKLKPYPVMKTST